MEASESGCLDAFKLSLLQLVVITLCVSPSVRAATINYDVAVDGASIGHLVFDANIGAGEQNLWGSLVGWELSWSGSSLTAANSQAAIDSLFVVDAAGDVITDVVEELVITGCTIVCSGYFEPSRYPLFTTPDGSSLGFYNSPVYGGVLLFDDGDGEEVVFSSLAYSGPSAVPLPAAAWLFGSAVLGLGVIKRRKTA